MTSEPQPPNTDEQVNKRELRTRLRHILFERYSESDLRTLCFDLGLEYDGLPGDGADGKQNEGTDRLKLAWR
jgi:hypothetical protein